MKKQTILALILLLVSSSACQFLAPSRPGIRISDCPKIVFDVRSLQSGETPQHILLTGTKQGNEFDTNQYFDALSHLSMREGYTLDYIYQNDGLGGYPLLYARPVEQVPYASAAEIPPNTQLLDFQEYLNVEDVEQGYFEYVVMDIMANQFYLFWHANYNDTLIVCNRQQIYDIVAQVSSGEFGSAMDAAQESKARTLRDIVPVVRLTEDTALVEVVTFTKWGGLYRLTYTISRETPHKIIDVKRENILPYECGVVF